jgi:5'-nucleotidase
MSRRPRPVVGGRFSLALVILVALVLPASALAAKPPAPPPVTIQVLNVSDWHGNLDPVGNLGGAWNLSARWQQDRLAGATLTLTAGDDFGAAPPLSGFFDEAPAVKGERLMGIQVNTFGNHNFDRGLVHLQSMIDLAGAPTDADHPGAPFHYVAANLQNLKANLTGVDPVEYFNVGGAKVAVIGIVNEEAPTLVSPGNFGTMVVTNGAVAANKYAQVARSAGANAVFVITHKGVEGLSPSAHGPLIDFANALTPGLVDVVFGDHTNIQYSGTVNGALVLENLSFGQSYAKTSVTVQPGHGGGVSSSSTSFVSPGPSGALGSNNTSCTGGSPAAPYCDQAIVDMLVPYRTLLSAALDGVIGATALPFDRGGNIERRQEVALGDLVADGMRATYGTDFGYMNSGGIRSQFPACAYQPSDHTLNRANYAVDHVTITACAGYGSATPYDLVKGDVYTVMPFGNNVLTRTVTGIQLWQMLENGVSKFDSGGANAQGRFPQVSGFKFTFRYDLATGCSGSETAPVTWICAPSRVTSVSWADGTPIPYDSTTYSVATIDFVNNGGDSYFMLVDGHGVTRDRDANVFLDYVASVGPSFDPSSFALDRITKCGAPC